MTDRVQCPVCGRQVQLGERQCPRCDWELESDYVLGPLTPEEVAAHEKVLAEARRCWQRRQRPETAPRKSGTGRVIAVTSGKGGVGKTTFSANVSAALAALGKKTIAVDMDVGLRNLDIVMGLENRIIYDLVDVVEGRCRLPKAIIRDKRVATLHMLPAAQTHDRMVVSPEAMEKICYELRTMFDFIIIDSPAGIEGGFANAIASADEVVIITTPHISSIRDADRVIGLLEVAEKQQIFLVINRLQAELVRRGDMLDIPDILDILAIDLLGIIPEDEFIVVTSNRGELASLAGSCAGQAYKNIARRLLGEDVPVLPVEEDKGLVKRLARLFKGQ